MTQVAKEHIQKIVTHPSAMLMLHDPHYVKYIFYEFICEIASNRAISRKIVMNYIFLIINRHGHFKKVMNPKLQETVHDMVADAHTMIDMWKNTKHEL